MKITWLGHSSFLIEDSKGRKLLTDPFDESVGYKTFDEKVDLVSISHHHFDHDYIANLKGDPKIIDKIGLFNLCDIPLKGIPSFHDDVKGAKRGENIIFVFEIDEYKICHLGDLGHDLSQDCIDEIGDTDLLLIPVGGNYTLDGKTAAKVAKRINSKIVIPMHYKTPHLSFPLEGVENFIVNMGNCERIKNCSLIIDKNILDKNTVKILDPRE
ncbi:MBL fold metallo-hydrolase [Clostridium sp. MB40-C1]|uniref:MBL fold metallo-hydrolase n=1 Tax=Clostridium sp. MB40-C1 TaxID=3070996 RepID=UPI0027E0B96E|nr:MBL fold metallo-hydrolase [Clostridium sp. MB40-C1]WMJ79826.1 MBL fold metallo-hydrolase [Clostridium sp. MB40-C1]